MRQRTFAPRRLAIFLVLTLALAAVGVTAVGFDAGTTELPKDFQPAQPLTGDKGRYDYALLRDDVLSSKVLPRMRFERMADTWTWDRMGIPVLAHHLLIEETGFWEYDGTSVAPANFTWQTEQVAYNETQDLWFGEKAEDQAGTEGRLTTTDDVEYRRYMPTPSRVVRSCLLQALPVDVDLEKPVPRADCLLTVSPQDPDEPMPSGEALHAREAFNGGVFVITKGMKAIGQADTAYGPAVIIEEKAAGITIRFWYVESIPYPVQAYWEYQGDGGLLRLAGFQRGHTMATEAAGLALLPPVHQTPAQPWGPSDEGVDLPYKPSQAWKDALADDGGLLSDFLREHPAAFTEYMSGRSDAEETFDRWDFQVRDGDARLSFRVERNPVAQQLALVGRMPDALRTTTVSQTDLNPDFYARWSDGTAPTSAPDLASANARLLAATGKQASVYTYIWDCADWVAIPPCDTDVGPTVQASTFDDTSSPNAVENLLGPAEFSIEYAGLTSHPDGGLREISTTSTTYQDSEGLLARAPERAAEPMPHATTAGWAVPAAPSVAGIGVAAAVLGLLYLFWPTAKSALLGLFSRTRDDELLELPARRAIHDAVQANPGVHLQELVRLTGLGKGTVEHHLRRLVQAGLLTTGANAGYTSYYPKGTDRRIVASGPALRSPTARSLLMLASANPGLRGIDASQRLGMNRGTILHHQRRLAAAGLLREVHGPDGTRLFATDLAHGHGLASAQTPAGRAAA